MLEKIKWIKRKLLYLFFLPRNFVYCFFAGVKWQISWEFRGLPIIRRKKNTFIEIGKNFFAVSISKYNTIGVSQPVIITATGINSKIRIGDDVGLSGCSITAIKLIEIGDRCLIGSGVLITDNDAHPIYSLDRRYSHHNILSSPVKIGDNVFIGARSIILKGDR